MAIAIISKDMLNAIPDFYQQVAKKVGKFSTRPSIIPDKVEVVFEDERFLPNDIVIFRIAKTQEKFATQKTRWKASKRGGINYYIASIGFFVENRGRYHYNRINNPQRGNRGKWKWKYKPKEYQVPIIKLAVI